MSDALLRKAHAKIGGVGLDITTFGTEGSVEIRWRRDYGDAGLSDQRMIIAPTLSGGLREVVSYENWADEQDAEDS